MALLLAVHLAGALLEPPQHWDSLGYHLPFPAYWVATGTLDMPHTAGACFVYPLNHELLLAWLMLPLHSDFVARFVGVGEWVMLLLALMGLARAVGMGRGASIGVAAIGSASLLGESVTSAGNDVAMAATFALALYFLLDLRRAPTVSRGLLAALAYGLFVGVKYPSLVYQVALVVAAAVLGLSLARQYRPFATEKGRLRGLVVGVLMCVAVLVGGGFAYVRNAAITGNPFFPVNVRVGPVTLIPGPMERTDDITPHEAQFPDTYSIRNIFFSETYFRALGPQYYLMLAAVLAAPLLLLRRRPRDAVDVLIVLLPFLLFALLKYGLTRQPPRLMGPFTVGCALTTAWVLVGLPRGKQLAVWLGLAVVGYYLMTARHLSIPPLFAQWAGQALLPALLPAAVGVGGVALARRLRTARVALALAGLVLLGVGLNSGLASARSVYDAHRYEQWRSYLDGDLGRGWEWIANATQERPATIAYMGTMAPPYALSGNRLRNVIMMVPRGPVTGCAMYGFGYPYGVPQADPQADYWLANLRVWKPDYLYVSVLYDEQRWPYEGHWAEEHPEIFKLAFESRRTRIYRVEL